ncbi:MAG: spore germination protein [Bacillota bacterium]
MKKRPIRRLRQENNMPSGNQFSGNPVADQALVAEWLGFPADLVQQQLQYQGQPAWLLYLEGMTNEEQLARLLAAGELGPDARSCATVSAVAAEIMNGRAALFLPGQTAPWLLGVAGWEHRQPEQPLAEMVIRGGREGFTEVLKSNLALVRRRLQNRHLQVKLLELGTEHRVRVALLYLHQLVDPALIREVEGRLAKANLRGVWDSGMLERWLAERSWSPFPQVLATERPDRVGAALAEGRVALLVDGSPFALIVPGLFTDFLTSAEDYYLHPVLATSVRWIRAMSFFIALSLPALYIALTTFHQEMLPTTLMLSIAAARSGVPMPAFAEALVMELAIELIREASLRLPGPMGNTLGVVGALVIGQAAVQAGLVGPILTVIVALTALATFAIPNYALGFTIRLLRFVVMLAAAVMGGFGLALTLGLILAYILQLEVYGIPYAAGFFPPSWRAWDDHPFWLGGIAAGQERPRWRSRSNEGGEGL